VVAVGTSSAFPDITSGFLWMIGLMIVVGFIIWIVRYGRGGVYDYE